MEKDKESKVRRCKHDYGASHWDDEALARQLSEEECGGEGTKQCIQCKRWYCVRHINDFTGGDLRCSRCLFPILPY